MIRMPASLEIDVTAEAEAEGARRATGASVSAVEPAPRVPDPEVPAKVQRRRFSVEYRLRIVKQAEGSEICSGVSFGAGPIWSRRHPTCRSRSGGNGHVRPAAAARRNVVVTVPSPTAPPAPIICETTFLGRLLSGRGGFDG